MRTSIVAAIFLILPASVLTAQVRLPQLIRDSMILQRDINLNIWGWASREEKVNLAFNGKKYTAKTGEDGKWKMQLAPVKAGGPYTMEISGKNRILLHDILVGDVWFCSGQSNMVHQMGLHAVRYEKEVKDANDPDVRQFWVANITNLSGPQEDLPFGYWKPANATAIREFSAVAYFMAKQLHDKYKIPIGIINASWGGVPIEALMSEESLVDFPAILATVQKNKDTAYVNGLNRRPPGATQSAHSQEDKGMTEKWFDPSYSPLGWRPIAIPGYWEDQGLRDLDGTVWYRREIEVPASLAASSAKVFLGRIVDADALYINGKQVGTTSYLYPQRRYSLPDGLLHAGKNLFVIRVTNNAGKGGFVPDKPYQLIGGKDTVDLTGYWQYKVGLVNMPRRGPGGGGGLALQNQPTSLYNSMVAPIVGYGIKGFAWYQGEANSGRANEYAQLQPAMIADWRKKWQLGELPFLFVQLPGFGDYTYLPSDGNWAYFREAQSKSLSVPNTGMAVAIDIGEWNDIHPDRKKDAGDRLALAAEKIAYGENIVYSGPVYQSAMVRGNQVVLSFTHAEGGLKTSDGEAPQEFAIAGADKKFVWAKATIDGDKIIVSNEEVTEPKYVRYGWADDPVNPNLVNQQGLPATPFRTDGQ